MSRTKKSLLLSCLSMLLCVAMLVGATFAWFTDSATTNVSSIQAGNLKIDLQKFDAAEQEWVSVKGETIDFVKAEGHTDEAILWEPGCTYNLPELRIVNLGDLALKYKIIITGINGDAELNNAIDWTMNLDGVIADLSAEHELLPGTAEAPSYDTFTIFGNMKTDAGNEYQGLAIDGITITVVATQDTVEYDSTTNQYDENAPYPWDGVYVTGATVDNRMQPESFVIDPTTQTITIKDAAALTYLNVYNTEAMYQWDYNGNFQDNSVYYYTWNWTVKLDTDIDLGNMPWKPISFGYKEFDGQGHTISNVNVNVTDGSAGLFSEARNVHDLTVKNVKVNNTATEGIAPATGGVIGNCAGKVKNVSLINATVTGEKYVGGIVGYGYADIENCLVDGATITNIGHKDVGGIVGFNTEPQVVTNNKVINTILKNTSDNTEKNIGAIVGRWNQPQLNGESCTFSGNTTTTEYALIGNVVNGEMPTQH